MLKKMIVPFFLIVLAGIGLFLYTGADENSTKVQKKEKVGLVAGDPTSTFENLEKKLKDEDILVEVNGQPLTLKEAKRQAQRERNDGNAKEEGYQNQGEVQREISQFISTVVFYDAFPVSEEEVNEESNLLESNLIASHGEEWGQKYLPNNELLKYILAEEKALSVDSSISVPDKFAEALTTVMTKYPSEVLKTSMENIEIPFINTFIVTTKDN